MKQFAQKSGQITFFILAALVVFLILVITYIVYNEFFLSDSQSDLIEATTPQTPLQTFIQQCIATQTRDAIERLGQQGGYVIMPDSFKKNGLLTFSPHPQREYVIPYWVNKNQVQIPSIDDMEIEIAEFVSDTLPYCLDDFALLGEANDIVQITNPQARVSINREDVTIEVSYSVSRSSTSFTQSFERFVYKEPVALQEIIDSAQHFAESISQTTFLEDMTIDLMSISDPIIPMSNINFRCDPKVWFVDRVQKDLQEILYYNVPYIKVKGAEFSEFEAPESVYAELEKIHPDDFIGGAPFDYNEIPSDTYQHAHMYYDSGNSRELYVNNIQIGARYLPEFGMDFTVRPATNGKMEGSLGEGTSKYLQYLCVQVYHFTYDISYPVEFIFRQNNAFKDGSPFVLRFGVSTNIDHNLPDKSPLSYTNPRQVGDYQSNEALCNAKADSFSTIVASDDITALDVTGVNVNYICHRYACNLGNTSLQDGRALLRTQLPTSCFGGFLQFTKDGYVPKEVPIVDAAIDLQQTYQVDMTPLISVDYKVVLGQNADSIIPTELRNNQYAVILLDDQFSDYETYATFDDQTRPVLELPNYGSTFNMTLLVYEDEELIGGYIGQLSYSQAQLRQPLTLHAFEFIPRPNEEEEFIEAWTYLTQNDVYKAYYQPKWGR